jgi:hypothetical protein
METEKPSEVSLLKSALYDYKGSDEELLLQLYKDTDSIIDRLCDASTDVEKYEFLGELFFEVLMVQMSDHLSLALPGRQASTRPEMLRNTRFEIMQFYELARAAKILKMKRNKTNLTN